MSLELPVLNTSYKWNSRKWGFVTGSLTCTFLRLQHVPARHPLFLLHSIPPQGYSRSTQPLIKWWTWNFFLFFWLLWKLWSEGREAIYQLTMLQSNIYSCAEGSSREAAHLRQATTASDRMKMPLTEQKSKREWRVSVLKEILIFRLCSMLLFLKEFILCYPFSDTSGTERTSRLYTGEPSYKSAVHRCNSLQVSFMRMSCYAGTKKLRL